MTEEEMLIVNENRRIDDEAFAANVHPVLIVTCGSTPAELAVILHSQRQSEHDLVPYRALAVDSLPYEHLITRMEQAGYPRELAEAALPRNHYFELTNPFSEGFDFNAPLNRDWKQTIFDPSLERIASRPDTPGAAGTPALGRARVEANEDDLKQFFQNRIQELIQIRASTFGLLEGVTCFLVTTARGGTGSGASAPLAAVIRSVLNGKLHLRCIMPCVFGGDERARANAFAVMVENQHHHRYRGRFPMKGNRWLPPPFDTANYIFFSNGTVALSQVDALMQESAILSAYLRPRTQAAINAREADLTEVIPHDFDDKPMHIRVATAVSIRAMHPGVQDYLVAEWVRQEVDLQQQRFESWCQDGLLNAEEQADLSRFVEQAKKDLNLTPAALMNRLDPGTSANAIRAYFEQARATLAAMKAQAVKEAVKGLPQRVKDLFANFERTWENHAPQIAASIPREVEEYVTSRLAATPHLAAAARSALLQFLVSIAAGSAKTAEREKEQRDAAGKKLPQALGAVQDAGGVIWLHKDEVTRNAAVDALNIAFSAASARARQQQHEYLSRALEGETSSIDARGKPMTVRGAVTALRNNQVEMLGRIRRHHASMLEALGRKVEAVALGIEKRSPVFQRAIMYDGLTRATLDKLVADIRAQVPDAPPILSMLQGKQSLDQTLAQLPPLLPLYAQSVRNLTQVLGEEPSKLNAVVQLLRNSKPFTPTDHVVEDQQGLSGQNRRDKLTILEVPGGRNGSLGKELLRQGVVSDPNCIVDSVEDEIRLFYLRDGLPYGAIKPIKDYKSRYDRYMEKPGAVTPFSVAGAQSYLSIEASQVNLRTHTEGLLYKAKAALPSRVMRQPSGHWILLYEIDKGNGFKVSDEIKFDNFDKMVIWLEKQVEIRKELNERLIGALNSNADSYKEALIAAWQHASDQERDHLQEELFNRRIDPFKFKLPENNDRPPWASD
jgi:tubulin-like protein